MDDLEKIFDHGDDITEENREIYLCVNKMLAYLFSWFICHINDYIIRNISESNTGKVYIILYIIYYFFTIIYFKII